MKKRVLASLLSGLLLLTAFTACGGDSGGDTSTGGASGSGEQVTVRVRSGWQEESLPNWPAAIEQYEKDNPNVKIEMEYTPAGEDAMTKLRAEFVSGDTPDVVQAWKTYFNEFVDAGLVECLNDEYEEHGWTTGTLMEGARSWCAPIADAADPNADVYGVADYVNNSVIFYNTDIFEEIGASEPTTIEELIDVSKKVADAGYKTMVVPGAATNITDLLACIQVQFTGVQYLIDVNAGNAKLTDEPMQEAMEIVQRLIDEGVVDKSSLTYKEDDAMAEFINGNAAMFKMHTSYNTQLMQAEAEDPNFHYAIMKGIQWTDNPVTEYSCTYGGCWMVPAASEVKEEAKDFLFYIFGPEVSKTSASEGGRITNMIAANSELADDAIKVVVDEQLPTLSTDSFYLVDMLSGTGLSALAAGMQGMVEGTMDASEALEQAQTMLEQAATE